jgi:hypothetical protein
LHNQPPDLQAQVQAQIDAAAGQGHDAVVLGYGLCGALPLVARDVPLVVPRARLHHAVPRQPPALHRAVRAVSRTYWYALDYIERNDGSGTSLSMGSGSDTDLKSVYDEYVKKYGRTTPII